jgi:hypothetical protein
MVTAVAASSLSYEVMMYFSVSFFAARCSSLALGRWLPTFRAMVAF